MKIRSQLELQQFLDTNLSWRKRELTTLYFQVSNSRAHEQPVLTRAAVALLYAHWEGFVKEAAVGYLEFVSRRRLPLRELRTNFVALAIRGSIVAASNAKKVRPQREMVDKVLDNLEQALPIDSVAAIDTEANLSSIVLQDILEAVGVEYGPSWQLKAPIIDHQLLKHRHEVVHGERTQIELVLYRELHRFVLDALDYFKSELENAAAMSSYRRPAA